MHLKVSINIWIHCSEHNEFLWASPLTLYFLSLMHFRQATYVIRFLTQHNCEIYYLSVVNYDPATTDLIFIRVNIHPGPGREDVHFSIHLFYHEVTMYPARFTASFWLVMKTIIFIFFTIIKNWIFLFSGQPGSILTLNGQNRVVFDWPVLKKHSTMLQSHVPWYTELPMLRPYPYKTSHPTIPCSISKLKTMLNF